MSINWLVATNWFLPLYMALLPMLSRETSKKERKEVSSHARVSLYIFSHASQALHVLLDKRKEKKRKCKKSLT